LCRVPPSPISTLFPYTTLFRSCNYSLTYSLFGHRNHMSPDDHFQDLKRVIAAIGGKARRINVIMPFLYESRQHKRSGRESLDCRSEEHTSELQSSYDLA